MKNEPISLQKYIFPNINQDGWKFVSIFALITALLGLLWTPLGLIGVVLTVTPKIKDVVVSPADGVVQMITRVTGPQELSMNTKTYNRISIFMSVFNVHVNRAPATGEIVKTNYIKGKFFNASLDKASKDNERQLIAMKTSSNKTIAFVQIAGLVARRIVCLAKEGDKYEAGDRFGWIRFGSRLDVYLPTDVEPLVCVGQTMIAGETILANLTAEKQERPEGVAK